MSFSTYGFGSTPTSSGGFAATRGRISGSFPYGVNYPSPFFDVAHTYLPTTVKQLFRYCRYYFLTNPLVNATVFKLSEYPVTDIIIDHEDPQVKKRWTEYYHDHLRYRSFEVETGLDYHCYGTCPVSVGFPFQKYLTCPTCGWSERADKIRNHWTFTNFEFRLNCPKCGSTGEAKVKDRYLKNANGIHLLRWNVEDIEVTYNDLSGQSTYFYTVPGPLKADIVIGKKDVVQQVPQIFIQALRQQKGVIFSKENLFVLKRPTLAWQDRGWGVPLLLPVLKDTFYLQLMKKAQEAILLEHIVPLRVLFPQAASGSSDPFTTINLTDWRDQVAAEIARWRFDNNYIPIMPLPVGQQTIGGDGRALLLFNEIQTLSEHIIMGMGVPREFLMGGMSYAGTNVSMRMLENAFISYVGRQRLMANWVMKTVAHFMEWPEVHIRFKPFKMADDIQRKAYLFQMNSAGKISDHTLASDSDLDQDEEDDMLIRETEKRLEATKKQQLAMAEIQGEAQMIMSKFQIKSQQAMMEAQGAPQAPGEPGGPEAAMGVGAAQQQAAMGPAMPGEGGPPMGAGSTAPPQAASPLGMGQDLGVAPQKAQAGGAPMGADLMQMAQMYAQQIAQMPPDQQQIALQSLSMQSPELAQLVQQMLSAMGARGAIQPPAGVDMRPNPDVLPPRRATPSI